MSITLSDIAASSGLAERTVRLILANRGLHVRESTRQLVLAAAAAAGLGGNGTVSPTPATATPTRSASATSLATVANAPILRVVLVLGSHARSRDTLTSELPWILQDYLSSHRLRLTFARFDETTPDGDLDGWVRHLWRNHRPQGVLMHLSTPPSPALLAALARRRLPAIWLAMAHREDAVYSNVFAAHRDALGKIAVLGHRRIAFLSPYTPGQPDPPPGTMSAAEAALPPHYSAVDGQRGYVSGLERAGLTPEVLPMSVEAVTTRLRQPDRPTAILAQTQAAATIAMLAAAGAGLRVPEDLSIVAVATPLGTRLGIAISQYVEPVHSLAWHAATSLRRRIEVPGEATPAIALHWLWITGKTLGAPSPRPA